MVRPRPGHLGGSDAAAWRETSESIASCSLQLEPRAQVVEQAAGSRPSGWRPPPRGPEAEAGGGQLLDLAVEPLELALERLPAVDEQEQVGERAGAPRGHRLVAGLAERLLAVLDLGAQLAHDARDRLAVELAGDAADVRRVDQRAQQPAAEVDP